MQPKWTCRLCLCHCVAQLYSTWLQVCEDWFVRMRPLLLRTSAAAAMHHATIRHGLRRLADLKHQMQGLLAHMNKLQQAAVSEQQSTAAAAAHAAWHSVTGAPPGKQQPANLASGTPGKLKVMARRQVCPSCLSEPILR